MIQYFATPTPELIELFSADRINVYRRVDIYEADNVTPFMLDAPLVSGLVSVDSTRDERRNLDITLYEEDGLKYGPGSFWYDKVIKPYRGIILPNGDVWATGCGEFLIDAVTRPNAPGQLSATCRDFTKKCQKALFVNTTTFAAGTDVATAIRAIATNAGIVKFNFATPGETMTVPVTYDRGSDRWSAMNDLAISISHELFFDNFGVLTLRPFIDPLTAALAFSFTDNAITSNLSSYSRSTNDSLLYNHVVIYSDNDASPLVYAEAENNNSASPTNINEIGRRTYIRASSVVTDIPQAQTLADSYLSVMSLEQYDVTFSSLVFPWFLGGEAVEFIVEDAVSSDPTRFLFSSFGYPLELGTMDANIKRVTLV